MILVVFKAIALIVIIITGVLGGLFALRLSDKKDNRRILSLGNSFGAGIFLGAGFIHMLPDAVDNYSQIISSDFPWVFFLCALGFLLILGLEQVVVGGHIKIDIGGNEALPPITTYLLTVILSVHSIITGIALGTENTLSLSIVIFLAVIAHKASASFALTTNLLQASLSLHRIKRVILIFSCMTPLGMIIGSLLDKLLTSRWERLTEGGFDALAAGTFIYVAVVDIINEEFSIKEDLWLKITFTSLGLVLMTLLAIWL